MGLLYKILCLFGIHKINNTKWTEDGILESDVFDTNCCDRYEEITHKYKRKRKNFRKIKNKIDEKI